MVGANLHCLIYNLLIANIFSTHILLSFNFEKYQLRICSTQSNHLIKERENRMTFNKSATFWKNKKKDWFSHQSGLVFVHGDVFKDGSRNSAKFKMELFPAIGNGRACNQWTVLCVCCCDNSTIFTGKIKIRWKWPCLEGGIRYNFLFYRHVFTFFRKRQLLSSHQLLSH